MEGQKLTELCSPGMGLYVPFTPAPTPSVGTSTPPRTGPPKTWIDQDPHRRLLRPPPCPVRLRLKKASSRQKGKDHRSTKLWADFGARRRVPIRPAGIGSQAAGLGSVSHGQCLPSFIEAHTLPPPRMPRRPSRRGGTWWVDFSVIGCLTVFLKDGKQTRMVLLLGYDKLLSAHNARPLPHQVPGTQWAQGSPSLSSHRWSTDLSKVQMSAVLCSSSEGKWPCGGRGPLLMML